MIECNVILQAGINTAPAKKPPPEYTVAETIIFYNYFCLKFGCFQAFWGTEKGVIKNCPNCRQNDEVMAKFE